MLMKAKEKMVQYGMDRLMVAHLESVDLEGAYFRNVQCGVDRGQQ